MLRVAMPVNAYGLVGLELSNFTLLSALDDMLLRISPRSLEGEQ